MSIRSSLLASFFLATLGCGTAAAPTTATPARAASPVDVAPIATPGISANQATAELAEHALLATRVPGDFVVYRLSGSFRKVAATLVERVVSDDGGLYVIDYTLTEGTKSQTFRVQLNDGAGAQVEILEVAAVVDGKERPATVSEFEAMMARTILSVDDNEATTSTEKVTVEVAGQSLACDRTTYDVRVGAREATMTITESRSFAWGDVGGSIVAKDGEVLYRAELVDVGGATGEGAVAIVH